MHTWQWRDWQAVPYLTCDLLEPWPHGFFTRQFSPQTPAKLVRALHPQALAYRVKQVHGNQVLKARKVQPYNPTQTLDALVEADGLLADQTAEAVWVASADCVPVLMADAETGQVCAVHAGWRGTAAKIVPEAVAQFQAQGSRISHLRVALGPAISGEVYQVSQEVALQLGQTIVPQYSGDSAGLITALFELPGAPVLSDLEPDKLRVDVRRFNALQLEQLGLAPEQIAIAPHCTYREPDSFFSYRRDGSKTVQWSGIVNVSLT
ncbi:MAG: peptidoglycan editing factor PgeF [Oscillatoriales cyanobacterium RM1_1_9]|nr:peptidoglycan editing factor PgeF [Oscillatoriales cyanobacterium SM2_3_0]NJO46804.1 peptidoglycan editing factor PgeF [Oscillatoriales cyanobacterium RM2_1_1]NJO71417.1 peptidoglycan editing factor PgeF [Oscillatoriales cyanobacterium RM1_1_9]